MIYILCGGGSKVLCVVELFEGFDSECEYVILMGGICVVCDVGLVLE